MVKEVSSEPVREVTEVIGRLESDCETFTIDEVVDSVPIELLLGPVAMVADVGVDTPDVVSVFAVMLWVFPEEDNVVKLPVREVNDELSAKVLDESGPVEVRLGAEDDTEDTADVVSDGPDVGDDRRESVPLGIALVAFVTGLGGSVEMLEPERDDDKDCFWDLVVPILPEDDAVFSVV